MYIHIYICIYIFIPFYSILFCTYISTLRLLESLHPKPYIESESYQGKIPMKVLGVEVLVLPAFWSSEACCFQLKRILTIHYNTVKRLRSTHAHYRLPFCISARKQN